MKSPIFPANTEDRCQCVYEKWLLGRSREPENYDFSGLALLLAHELALIDSSILDWVKKLPEDRKSKIKLVEN